MRGSYLRVAVQEVEEAIFESVRELLDMLVVVLVLVVVVVFHDMTTPPRSQSLFNQPFMHSPHPHRPPVPQTRGWVEEAVATVVVGEVEDVMRASKRWACVRVCVRVCVPVCVRVCVRGWVRVCVRV